VTARFLLVVSDDLKKQMQRLARKNGMAPARWARLACAYAIENRSPVIDVVDPVKRPGRPRKAGLKTSHMLVARGSGLAQKLHSSGSFSSIERRS